MAILMKYLEIAYLITVWAFNVTFRSGLRFNLRFQMRFNLLSHSKQTLVRTKLNIYAGSGHSSLDTFVTFKIYINVRLYVYLVNCDRI